MNKQLDKEIPKDNCKRTKYQENVSQLKVNKNDLIIFNRKLDMYMKSFNISFLLFLESFLLFPGKSNCQKSNDLFEFTPHLIGKYFYWGEYNDYSFQMLEEYGNLFGGGFQSKIKFSRSFNLYINVYACFSYGIVNYNGFLQNNDGTFEAYKSETVYDWFESTLNFGYDFYAFNSFTISPEFGFQFESWDRDIDNGGQYGYDEIYDIFLIDFGFIFTALFSSKVHIFFKILGEYPLLIEESINLAIRGQGGPAEINLEPKPNIGINLELGANIHDSFLSVFMDYMIFSKSLYDNGFHQPESDRSVVGIKLGYTF